MTSLDSGSTGTVTETTSAWPPWVMALALLAVYVATLAPSVTFWDAGEFIAAARHFGIPHPPGTPLFMAFIDTLAHAFWFLPFARATNLGSALTTAAAGGLTTWWMMRSTRSAWAGAAAAITAGAMSSVWANATETEVYAASLCLALAAIVAGDRAGRSGDRRYTVLAAYLLALALPVHLSALVAAPVVILLAADRGEAGGVDWSAGTTLLGVSVCIAGASRLSLAVVLIGVAILGVGAWLWREGRARAFARAAGVIVIACSALLIMLVRARHDPAINQANPSTWSQLAYAVGRQQYDVAGLWPRQAPLWLQIANWFEYADWQFALGLAPTVIPSVGRVVVTVAFAVLGIVGAQWHWRRDRRTWRAVLLLFVCGSLGVIVYLNLKAGTSFGWQFVSDDARHEARDRDYFFVLGFWAWGMWAGMGALWLARAVRMPAIVGLALAALPVALNWSVVDRRAEPDAGLPREIAHALLDPLPRSAVLFVAGDNDTYPLWYAQQVEGRRKDVTIVTMPLLAAPWYGSELARRDSLQAGPPSNDLAAMAAGVARTARARGRPVAAALTVPAADRNQLGRSWRVIGLAAVDLADLAPRLDSAAEAHPVVQIDTAAVQLAASKIEAWRRGREARPAPDPVDEYFLSVLGCPRLMLASSRTPAQLDSLDSTCNLR